MSLQHFHRDLEYRSQRKLQLKINDNRHTMVSVRWGKDYTKVSLHRMFLTAPQNVMDALACYILRDDKSMAPKVKSFIEENVKKLNYSHLIDKNQLFTQGTTYNLITIFNDLNREYFDNRINLSITWFGNYRQRARSRVTFGLYHESLKLIKIHRLLDNPMVPEYVVSYVVYHEMLHHDCPSYYDDKGINRIHSKEFKSREVLFKHFDIAKRWMKAHQEHLFKGFHGWS